MQKLNTLVMTMHKKLWVLLFCSIFLIGMVSAGLSKEYDNENKIAKIKEGIVVKTDLADIQLKTPLEVKVGAGYQKVAEFQINSKKDYFNAINNIDLYDKKDGMKKFERHYDLKYKATSIVWVEDTEVQCNKLMNGTLDCKNVVIGQHQEEREVWIPLTSKNIISGSVYTIGIFTNVKVGDRVEWIPNFFDNEIRIEEWAVWTADLNVDLIRYYKLNEASGALVDSTGTDNGTNSGADYGVTGIINDSLDFESTDPDYAKSDSNTGLTGADSWSMNAWVNFETMVTTDLQTIFSVGTFGGANYVCGLSGDDDTANAVHINTWGGIGVGDIATGVTMIGNWNMYTMTYNGTTLKVYVNGLNIHNTTGTLALTDDEFYFGGRIGGYTGQYLDGIEDEVSLWAREISGDEVIQLYNEGSGITYTGEFPPTVVLNSPVNDTSQATSLVTFNITVTDAIKVDNVTLYIDEILNETNSSNFNGTYIFTKYLTEGTHNWSILAYNNDSNSTQSETRTITIDLISPVVNITFPTEDYIYQNNSNNSNGTISGLLNWTIDDVRPGNCTYYIEYNESAGNGTTDNITVDCVTNGTLMTELDSDWITSELFLCGNDTAGNEDCQSQTFRTNQYEENIIYNETAIEESTYQFNLTIELRDEESGVFDSFEGNLSYNGTETTCDVDNRTLYCEKVLPSFNTSEEVSFYFNYILNGIEINSSSNTQTIYNFTGLEVGIDSCGAGLSTLVEFSFFNENNLTALNTTGAYLFRYGLNENSSARTTNGNYSNSNKLYLCVNSTLGDIFYMGYGEIQYQETSKDYTERRYYVFEGTRVSNVTTEINAYSLNNAESTSFLMTMQNSDLKPYVGHYISLQRWYPNYDDYRIVELAKTDDDGGSVLKIETEDVDYRIGLYSYNGTLIHLTSPFRLTCLTSPCSYTINVPTSGTNLFDRWEGLDVSLTYNETTKMITYIYSDPTQSTQNMTLNVYQETGTSSVLICTDSSTGYSGVMSCNVSGYSGLVRAVGVRSASPETAVTSKLIHLARTTIENGAAMFITLVVTALLVFIGTASPILGVILTVLGFIPALVFGLIPLGIIMPILCLGFLVIYFMKKT